MTPGHSIEAALALTLLHSLWQDAVLALLAAGFLSITRRRSAALRHAIGMVFLLAMAAAPLITFSDLVIDPALALVDGQVIMLPASAHRSLGLLPQAASLSAPLWLPWAWGVGVIAMLVRLVGGWWVLRTMDRQPSAQLPDAWRQRADAMRLAMGIQRRVVVRLLHGSGLPCSAHAWRPVIWLPVSMLTQLSPDQIEALIAHELGHIRRLDWVWNGLQCFVEAVLFYHPGVWWLGRRIRQERENACDDLAVAACGDAIVLAEALSTLEGLRVPARTLALSANGGSLMQRITRLLSPDASPSRMRWGAPLGLLAVLCSGALLAAQTDPAIHSRTHATIETPHWWQMFGDSTELHETVGGSVRVYRQWMDSGHRVHELYTVDGRPLPVDASVRQWIASAQVVPPVPPVPPMPPLPPAPSVPPVPPVPPPPMSFASSPAFAAAANAVRNDPHLISLLGTPITASVGHGSTRIDDDSASLSIALSGPKGTARLRAEGRLKVGRWQFSTLEVDPEDGESFEIPPHS
jgi:beta-lactamase regulating signal transducer with metallopeptidase domain